MTDQYYHSDNQQSHNGSPNERVVYVQQKNNSGKWIAIVLGGIALIVIALIAVPFLFGMGLVKQATDELESLPSQSQISELDDSLEALENNPLVNPKNSEISVNINSTFLETNFLGSSVCVDSTVTNNGNDQSSINTFEFTLQNPQGVIVNSNFTGTLSTFDLIPGGSNTGTICFEGDQPGDYILNYTPLLSQEPALSIPFTI